MKRAALLVLLLMSLVLVLAACGGTATTPTAEVTVTATPTAETTETATSTSTVEATETATSTATAAPTETVTGAKNSTDPNGVPPGSVPESQVVDVEMDDFAFVPATVTIKAGMSVEWKNRDSAPHDLAWGDYKSKIINEDESFVYTFVEPGTYEYICAIHPSMKGTITVE